MRRITQTCWTLVLALSLAALWGATPLAAFEGVVKQRSINIDGHTLYGAYVETHGDPPESTDALIQWVMELPVERLMEIARSDAGGHVSEETLYVKGDKFRADIEQENAPMDYVLADMDQGLLTMVNSSEKIYVEFSPEGMKAMVDDAMNQAAQAMREAGMDEAAIEQMLSEMKGKMPQGSEPAAAGPSYELKPLGRSMRIGSFDAEGYVLDTGEERIVGWLTKDTYGIGAAMKAFVEKMSKAFEMGEGDEGDPEDALWEKGLPVRIQNFHLDSNETVTDFDQTDIVEVESRSLPDDLFRVPAGFTKKTPQELFGMQP